MLKNFLLFLFLFYFFTLSVTFSQWYPLNSGTTFGLNCLDVVDSKTVFAAGDMGIILKTIDGGNTWTHKAPVFTTLWAICFYDNRNGVVCGDGKVLKTTDGGNLWTQLNGPWSNSQPLSKIWYPNPDNITVVEGNKYYYTTNGGDSWQHQYSKPNEGPFVDLAFFNPDFGVLIQSIFYPPYHNLNVIHISTNGGISWTKKTDLNFNGLLIKRIAVLPDDRIYAAENYIHVSSNLGNSWEQRGGIPPGKDLFFLNPDTGITVGQTGIFTTTDGGYTWRNEINGPFNAVAYADSTTGYAVGTLGKIFKTGPEIVSEVEVSISPDKFLLEQNYPNPFNNETNIRFEIQKSSFVIMKVFDVMGNEIVTQISEEKPAGQYELNWNAADLPSGVYFYQIKAGAYVETRKMILMK